MLRMTGAGSRQFVSAVCASTLAVFDEIIFSLLLPDIIHLPFDSNSIEAGVSRYVDANGSDQ